MTYRKELRLRMPGAAEPEVDQRVVLQYAIDELRKVFNEAGSNQAVVKMSDLFEKTLKFTVDDKIDLMAMLQRLGVIKQVAREHQRVVWRFTDVQNVAETYSERMVKHAWEAIRRDGEHNAARRKREREARESRANKPVDLSKYDDKPEPSDDETLSQDELDFLAQIDQQMQTIASERDAAIAERDAVVAERDVAVAKCEELETQVTSLREEVASLSAKLTEQPPLNRKVMQEVLLDHFAKYSKPSQDAPTPTKRRRSGGVSDGN